MFKTAVLTALIVAASLSSIVGARADMNHPMMHRMVHHRMMHHHMMHRHMMMHHM